MLPLDIRRNIYLQLWHFYGTTQHIYLFGESSCLSHYPCLLGNEEAFNYHRPPSPPPPRLEQPNDEASQAQSPSGAELEDNENDLVTGYQEQEAAQVENHPPGDDNQPGIHDDPGDIDGAIQDIAAQIHDQAASVFTATNLGLGNDLHQWDSSPWCMHEKCFRGYMECFGMSFEHGYSRNYKRAPRAANCVVGITKPMLVCKNMYIEASESLYSKIIFSFPNMLVLERFMNDVPWALSKRIQAVNIVSTTPIHGIEISRAARSLFTHNSNLPSLLTLCTKLEHMLRGVQELRLCLHLTHKCQSIQPRPLPNKTWFEPLYKLSYQLQQQRLRKMQVNLVVRCDAKSSDGEELMTYGFTPGFLKDAPFGVVLVPQGWHSDSECGAYWIEQNGAHVEGI